MRTMTGLAIGVALLAGSGCHDFSIFDHLPDGSSDSAVAGGPGDGFVLAMMGHDGSSSSGDAGDVADMAAAPDALADVPDLTIPPDLVELPDLAPPPDLTPPLDLVSPPDLLLPCAGWRGGPNNACWYIGQHGQDCNTTCMPHGGFDVAGATHGGGDVTSHFYPQLTLDHESIPVEAVSLKVDGVPVDKRWTANGTPPKGTEILDARLACACLN